jgi:potassium efflux system protein
MDSLPDSLSDSIRPLLERALWCLPLAAAVACWLPASVATAQGVQPSIVEQSPGAPSAPVARPPLEVPRAPLEAPRTAERPQSPSAPSASAQPASEPPSPEGTAVDAAGGAANPAVPPADGKVSVQSVTETIAQIKAEQLDEALQKSLLELYEQALADCREADAQSAQAEAFAAQTRGIPQEIEGLKKQKGGKAEQPALLLVDGDRSLTNLRQELSQLEELHARQKDRRDAAMAELKNVGALEELAQKRKLAQDRLAEVEEQLKKLPAGADANRGVIAERVRWRAGKLAAQALLARYEKEAAYRQAQTELLPLRRDIAAAEMARLEEQIGTWRDEIAAAQARELKAQGLEAREITEDARAYSQYPLVLTLADHIDTLHERRRRAVDRVPEVVQQIDDTKIRLEGLVKDFEQSIQRVEAAGRSQNIGVLLRIQQNDLPDTRVLRRQIFEREVEIEQAQLELYEMSDRTGDLANIEKAAQAVFETPTCRIPAKNREAMRPFLERLLETEKQHLDGLITEYQVYLANLWALDEAQRRLLEVTEEYRQFISEHVLWIRSTDPLWQQPLDDYRTAARWLTSPGRWVNVGKTLAADLTGRPLHWLAAALALSALVVWGRRMRRALSALGEQAARKNAMTFLPTARALALTVLIAVPLPLALYFVGWRLSQHLEAPLFVTSVAAALQSLGQGLLPLEIFRQLCRNHGVARAHFNWAKGTVSTVRRNVRWFVLIVMPISFVASTLSAASLTMIGEYESLGRLGLIAALVVIASFGYRLLRPSSKLVREILAYRPDGLLRKTHYLWPVVGVGVPLVLAGLAVAGFQYTAAQIVSRLYWTCWIVLGLVVFDALVQRWLLVTRRRMALEQYRQRREAAEAAALADGGNSPTSPVAGRAAELADDPPMDLAEMNEQTRQLLRSLLTVGVLIGLWVAWVDVLPALAVLRNIDVPFLTIERAVESPTGAPTDAMKPPALTPPGMPAVATDPTAVDPASEEAVAPKTVRVPITLADIILSVLITVMTIAAARNLPGLMEITLLQRLPLDNAARYAITTLSRYALIFIGGSAAFYTVGFRWQNVQWLAAALMLGLGFGLQEIFANFFSGLIVLIERPVRVGDIVSVGNVDGVVSRIRMRATTITNWERKEMIIPNKELITGRVLNWTLSDQVQRVFISVGIAHGSDTEKATETLYRVLREHPAVMNDPAPCVTFSGFGESTLNFEVRCFLPRADLSLPTKHELNTRIDQAFREAGIKIAYPQRDLHVRTVQGAALLPTPRLSEQDDELTARTAKSA